MVGILTILGALVIVGGMVWYQFRFPVVPPNARILRNLWHSMGREEKPGKRTAARNAAQTAGKGRVQNAGKL